MTFTEQVAVLDGYDLEPRIHGTGGGFDWLAELLAVGYREA